MAVHSWIMQILGEQINGRSIIDFFHQDTSGPMADLRQEFKRKARSVYDDNRFFRSVARGPSRAMLLRARRRMIKSAMLHGDDDGEAIAVSGFSSLSPLQLKHGRSAP